MINSPSDDMIHKTHDDDDGEVASSVEAVRCLYLAKVIEKQGHYEAAQRWKEKAIRWLNKGTPNNNQPTPSAIHEEDNP